MKRVLSVSGVFLILLIALRMPVHAAGLDKITGNMVLETSVQADLHEEASDDSKIVATLEAGTAVFTLEDAENSWCKISAGSYTGYIKVEFLKTVGDREAINQEFEENKDYNHTLYDEIEQLEEQKSREKTAGMVIAGVAVTAVVAGCIFIKLKSKKQAY